MGRWGNLVPIRSTEEDGLAIDHGSWWPSQFCENGIHLYIRTVNGQQTRLAFNI